MRTQQDVTLAFGRGEKWPPPGIGTRSRSPHPRIWRRSLNEAVTINAVSVPPHIRGLVEAEVRNNPRRVASVVDYALVTTDDHGGRTPAGFSGQAQIEGGVSIERLGDDLSRRLLRASELRGEDWDPTHQDHVVHAYVRTVWTEGEHEPPDQLYHWDNDGRIYSCIQLSRLVRDNATSTEHAVRRLVRADGTERLVPFEGFDSHVAYRLYPEEAGWLDVDEAQQLGVLARAYREGPALPTRVGRALRRADVVTRERYLEEAVPLVVGGLESVLKIGRYFARAQFAQRVPAVAGELGVSLTEAECGDLYDDRSALVHGADVDLSQPHDRTTFERGFIALQETLRRTVRRAIEEPEFAAIFRDDATISAHWPAIVRRGGKSFTI